MGFTAILYLGATPFQLGLLAAARLFPGFLMGLAAGAWADRLRKRPLMIGADIGRAVLLASIPLAAALGLLRIEQLYVVTFLVSILTVFFDVAYQSYLPVLTGREDLREGNGKLAASAAVSESGGFAVAGWLVQWLGAPLTILFDALSFGVSSASLWLIDNPEPAPEAAAHRNMRREIAEGVRAVLREPLLRAAAVCTLSKEFFVGIYGTVILLYMVRDLGFSAGVLGSIWAVGGLSSFMGAIFARKATERLGIGPAMIVGLALFGVALLLVPLARGATVMAGALLVGQQLLGDGAVTVYQINMVTLRQSIAPERVLGRVNAGSEFLRLGGMLAGSVLGGVMGDVYGARNTLFVGAAGTLASVIWLLLSPLAGFIGSGAVPPPTPSLCARLRGREA